MKKILWVDAIAGGSTGIIGLALSGHLTAFSVFRNRLSSLLRLSVQYSYSFT